MPVQCKHNGSPLTLADQAAHCVISKGLYNSSLVVVSEEGEDIHLAAERYWLVDPLDGTKDFLASNGEFTVNIVLVDQCGPVLGVVFAPAINELYWGVKDSGAWRVRENVTQALAPLIRSTHSRVVTSRFHDHPDVELFFFQNDFTEYVAIGLVVKYCLLAAGEVDVSPRLMGSSEWDTVAGQAVLEAAGYHLLVFHTGKSLGSL